MFNKATTNFSDYFDAPIVNEQTIFFFPRMCLRLWFIASHHLKAINKNMMDTKMEYMDLFANTTVRACKPIFRMRAGQANDKILPNWALPIAGLWFLWIFPDFRIFYTNLPLPQPQHFLERRELATKERKK